MGIIYGVPVSGLSIPGLMNYNFQNEKSESLTGGEFGFEGSIIASILISTFIIGLTLLIWRRDQQKSSDDKEAMDDSEELLEESV